MGLPAGIALASEEATTGSVAETASPAIPEAEAAATEAATTAPAAEQAAATPTAAGAQEQAAPAAEEAAADQKVDWGDYDFVLSRDDKVVEYGADLTYSKIDKQTAAKYLLAMFLSDPEALKGSPFEGLKVSIYKDGKALSEDELGKIASVNGDDVITLKNSSIKEPLELRNDADVSSIDYDKLIAIYDTPGRVTMTATAHNSETVKEGTSFTIQVAQVHPRAVTATWAGTEGRLPNDGASVTASLPEGAVLAGDDVTLAVTGGDSQDEGTHEATAALAGADASKYELTNPVQPYTVGTPKPDTPTNPDSDTKPATTPAATTTPAGDTKDDRPASKSADTSKALPQTGDSSAAGMVGAGIAGALMAAIGFLTRRRA